MRQSLDEKTLDMVSGGKYAVNKNKRCIYFQNIAGEYQVKAGVSLNDAVDLMDSFMGKYPTEEAYDAACLAALRSQGFID